MPVPRVKFQPATSARTQSCQRCMRYGRPKRAAHWHHYLSVQRLRMYVSDQRLSKIDARDLLNRLVHDARNMGAYCLPCHFNHENYSARIPRDEIPKAAWDFAAELGLEHALDRAYRQ